MTTVIAPTPWETRYDGPGGICLSDADGRQIGFLSLRKEQESHAELFKVAPETAAERDILRRQRDDSFKALREIAAHHEHQRELWSSEEKADADQASYHKERRDFARSAIIKATGCEV